MDAGVPETVARPVLRDRVGSALWMIAVFPDALWHSILDRRKRASAPRVRCAAIVVDEDKGSVSGLRLGGTLEDVYAVFGPGLFDPSPPDRQPSPTLPNGMAAPPGSRPG